MRVRYTSFFWEERCIDFGQVWDRGRSKRTSPGGEEKGGSDRLVTNDGDRGGREVLASGDVTIKNVSL